MTKALTLRQPWASLVALGVKTIETRSWSTSYRGRLVIHAAKRPIRQKEVIGDWEAWPSDPPGQIHPNYGSERPARIYCNRAPLASVFSTFNLGSWRPLPLGAVVATCTLLDVVPITDPDLESQHEHQRHLIASPPESGLRICRPSTHSAHGWTLEHCEDQRPYGDFSPGRYAWLISDVHALAEPLPCQGRQGLWTLPEEVAQCLTGTS